MSKYSKVMPEDSEHLKSQFGETYKYIKNGSIVLDVGCSTGYYGGLLKKDKQCTVYGVDINRKDLEKAKKKLDKAIYLNLEEGSLPNEIVRKKFDIIFLGDVIEHLKDPSLALKIFRDILADDGYMIISIPNISHISIRLELLNGSFEYEDLGILDDTHLKYFTIDSISEIIKSCNLNIDLVDYSTNDLSKTTIKNFLDRVGLTYTKLFYERVVNTPQARAYQYKIVVSKSAKKHDDNKIEVQNKPLVYEYDKLHNKQLEIEELKFTLLQRKEQIENLDIKIKRLESSLFYWTKNKAKLILKNNKNTK